MYSLGFCLGGLDRGSAHVTLMVKCGFVRKQHIYLQVQWHRHSWTWLMVLNLTGFIVLDCENILQQCWTLHYSLHYTYIIWTVWYALNLLSMFFSVVYCKSNKHLVGFIIYRLKLKLMQSNRKSQVSLQECTKCETALHVLTQIYGQFWGLQFVIHPTK